MSSTKQLDVYLHSDLCGHLISDEHGQLGFYYAASWLESANPQPLSQALPLQSETFNRKACRGFFAGLLPDEHQRVLVARNLGVSHQNDFSLLEKIGGDCAGAVTLMPSGKPLPRKAYSYQALSESELATLLGSLSKQPLLAGVEDVRLSLAGAQNKLAVHVSGDTISLPLNGAPSTHIIKPAITHFEGLVYNEALCLQLAEALRIPTASATIKQAEQLDYLLVKRYDRKQDANEPLKRLHQEDFCQALGINPENKYQNEGGPTFSQCFALLRACSTTPLIDLQNLLNACIFNFLIGNNDAHGKNFSLLYEPSQASCRFAPLYDLVCTLVYPELSKKMAMKIGKEYDSSRIFPRHFERLATEAGLTAALLLQRTLELADAILIALPSLPIQGPKTEAIAEFIQQRCISMKNLFSNP